MTCGMTNRTVESITPKRTARGWVLICKLDCGHVVERKYAALLTYCNYCNGTATTNRRTLRQHHRRPIGKLP